MILEGILRSLVVVSTKDISCWNFDRALLAEETFVCLIGVIQHGCLLPCNILKALQGMQPNLEDKNGYKGYKFLQILLFGPPNWHHVKSICFNVQYTELIIVLSESFSLTFFMLLFLFQVYPTINRALGLGCCSAIARIGAMLTPFVAQVSKTTAYTVLWYECFVDFTARPKK